MQASVLLVNGPESAVPDAAGQRGGAGDRPAADARPAQAAGGAGLAGVRGGARGPQTGAQAAATVQTGNTQGDAEAETGGDVKRRAAGRTGHDRRPLLQ